MKENFERFIALVWPEDGDFDSPKQGYHVTAGDSGGGTYGGVIETTWQHYVASGLVSGALKAASYADLKAVLRAAAWGTVGDALPAGLDILIANGRMMTGQYAAIVEECLGWTGTDVDNVLGPHDLARIAQASPRTLMLALHGNHYAYLARLASFEQFKNGWLRRINAALAAAEAALLTPAADDAGV
jgi:lysozyme family protein